MRFLFILLGLLLLSNSPLSALVGNTKHNLSATNIYVEAGTIKAVAETEECVFCHIPHLTRPESTPLWNREMPDAAYSMYDSDYLRRMGYPAVASDLGRLKGEPGALSRQCLSCHDGTIAVGAVYKLREDIMGGASVAMVDGVDTIPVASSTSFDNNDLTNHHPVGIEYNANITKAFDVGSRTSELKATPDDPIRLYTYGGTTYVECTSCHNPHTENDMFLHVGSEANLGLNIVKTCTSCHDKTGWTDSVHQSAIQIGTTSYSDPDVLTKYGTAEIAKLGCANCHTPHNAESTQYLNRYVQASTCYQGAASTVAGANCHGALGAKDIQTIIDTKSYKHPVDDSETGEKHTNLDVLYGTGVAADDALGISWTTNKHAVCMDCHNPHQAQKGTHITDGTWYGTPSVNGNLVSPALTGVAGVNIDPLEWPAIWTQPTNLHFKTINAAEYEWQICLKCHSYWGMGSATGGVNDDNHISPSDLTNLMTDVAWEMNINNKSGHPVIIPQDERTGSDTPRALLGEQMIAPWVDAVGQQTMYCSDCHGNDREINGDPKGPHGSDQKYLLKGVNQYWPLKPDGVTLYTMDDIGEDGTFDPDLDDTGAMCKNCHDIRKPHTDWWNKMAGKGFECVQCHVVIPHGSPVSRLQGYYNFPAPYNYTDANGTSHLQMMGFRKDPLRDVNESDAWVDRDIVGNTCDGATCHRDNDEILNGGQPYDTNPYP